LATAAGARRAITFANIRETAGLVEGFAAGRAQNGGPARAAAEPLPKFHHQHSRAKALFLVYAAVSRDRSGPASEGSISTSTVHDHASG